MHRNGFAVALPRAANNGHNGHNGHHNNGYNNYSHNQAYNNTNQRLYLNGHLNGHQPFQSNSRRRTVSSGETEHGHPIYRDYKSNGSKQHHSVDMKKDLLKLKSVENSNIKLNSYRKDGKLCDFKLLVGDKVFPVHKVILSAASGYFDVMFSNQENFIENETNTMPLHEVDPQSCETLLNYIYTGEIKINSHNVQDIARISNMFQLLELVEYCSKFLESNLRIDNCIGILRFADFYAFQALYFEAKHYVERLYAEVCTEEEFLELSPKLLRSFLRSESLSIDSEYQVLSSTMNWIMKDEAERLQYLDEFINLIRMPLISVDQIKKFSDTCSSPAIVDALAPYLKKDTVGPAGKSAGETANNVDYNFIRLQPRMCSRRRIYVLGGLTVRQNERQSPCTLHTMIKLNLHTGSWDYEPPFCYPRSAHCVVTLNQKLYLIGGECESLVLHTMEIFDPKQPERWTPGANMTTPRSSFGACVHGDYIYAFGGKGQVSGQTIERFDPKTDRWEDYDRMPAPRHGLQVVEHDGLIYIIGGRSQNQALNSLLSYNPETRQFRELAKMNNARSDFGCAILHGHIYVIGGLDSSNEPLTTVEKYNISENKWNYLAPLKSRRASLCAIAINNLIYTFGGIQFNSPRSIKDVNVYDPNVNQWFASKSSMPENRCHAVAVTFLHESPIVPQ